MTKKIDLVLICFLVLLNLVQVKAGNLEKKVSFSVESISVIDVLHEIESKADVIFSFKSDAFDKNKLISLKIYENSISEVLNIIFKNQPILYKEIGNQIVLYVDKPENEVAVEQKPEPIIKVVNDTVFKYINTTRVKVYDTTRYVFFDTIRPKPEPVKKNLSFELGISPVVCFPKIMPQLPEYDNFSNIVKNAEQNKLSYNVYGMIITSIKNLKLSAGFIYSKFNEISNYHVLDTFSITTTEIIWKYETKLDSTAHKFTISTGGGGGKPASTKDTTIWSYSSVTTPVDSLATTTKTDTLEVDSEKKNQYKILSFPFMIGYEFPLSDKFALTINSGPSIDVLVSKTGHILNPANDLKIEDFSEVPFIKLNLSWVINTGINYHFNKNWSATFHINYFQGLQPVFSSDFPFKKTSRNLAFSFGCKYSL